MSDSTTMCPLCGGELTDIRADEPDSARLGEMRGRLFDALAAATRLAAASARTSDRARVECLVGLLAELPP